jgi:hypothetical protein
MNNAELARKLAPILAPTLPYLLMDITPPASGKDAAKKALGGMFVEDTWNKAEAIWNVLKPELDKKNDVANELKEIAQKPNEDLIVTILEKILKDMPQKQLEKIQDVVRECTKKTNWKTRHNAGIFIGLGFIILLFFIVKFFEKSPWPYTGLITWGCVMAGLILIFLSVGYGFVGLPTGLLIDRRNMLSLSKLQMLLWTFLVISGYIAIVQISIAKGINNPLDVGIPATLWALMGISTVGLIGSPLIKNDNFEATIKSESKDSPKGVNTKEEAINDLKLKKEEKDIVGTMIVNECPEYSRFSDLFRGEEVGNYLQPDLGKLQMFLFTFIIWFAYAAFIWQLIIKLWTCDVSVVNDWQASLLANPNNSTAQTLLSSYKDFPDVSGGMAAMLAISNAGYLAFKAVPREKAP